MLTTMAMMIRLVAIFVLMIFVVRADAETNWEYLEQSPERIIGLLELPDIAGEGCGALVARATANAFASPAQNSIRVGTVFMRDEGNAGCGLMIERVDGVKEDLPTLETGYEIGASIVYERRDAWYRIALKNGSAWIRRDNPKNFRSYPEILRDRLGHLAENWQGTLRSVAGPSSEMARVPRGLDQREIGMKYLGSRQIGRELWLHVELVTEQCSQTVEGVAMSTAWIRAYRPNGSPAAWFRSRGC
jgi:hypothetical protein